MNDSSYARSPAEGDEIAAVERLHELVEEVCSWWKGSMPVERLDESTAVKQDRLTCRDILRQADAIKKDAGLFVVDRTQLREACGLLGRFLDILDRHDLYQPGSGLVELSEEARALLARAPEWAR